MKHWIDLVIPLVLIIGCFALMACGIDGEVKSVLAIAAGWAFRSTYGIAQEVKKPPEPPG